MPEHAFILGGTGQIGRALVDALLARGWHVTASHRGHGDVPRALMNGGTRLVAFDREAPKALENALGGGVDALIDTIAFDEGHADQLLAVQGLVGSITLISSISVYCDAAGRTLDEATDETNCPVMPIPIAENHMTVPGGSATYSTRKVSLERKLLEHAKRPVTIVRPGAIHGPGSRHPREWWFVKRFLDGRGMVPLKYQGGSRFSTTSVRNLAAVIMAALQRPATRIVNAVDPHTLTVSEIGMAIADYLGVRCQMVGLGSPPANWTVGESPWSTAFPFVASDAAARSLGYEPAETYVEAIPSMCDWLMAHAKGDWRAQFPVMAAYPWDPFDYAAEDAVLRGL